MPNSKHGSFGEPSLSDDFFRPSRKRQRSRKTQQLCAQVARAVADALWIADDDRLLDLQVHSVETDGGPHRLAVLLTLSRHAALCADEATRLVDANYPRIRAEVAASISRRRVPHLTFVVLPETEEAL